MPEGFRSLLLDADVLIDYHKSDIRVLGLVSKYMGNVHVLTRTLSEVDGLDAADCERQGLRVLEPELKQLTRAAGHRGRLSFRDRLCLIVAADAQLVCVTNDKLLRKTCEEEGVASMWGMEMMLTLVKRRAMRAVEAIRIAEKIHLGNPFHIPRPLVDRFKGLVITVEKDLGGI